MSVTYVDANVFVFAFLKLKRKLQPHEENIKEAAKKIISRVNAGEKVVMSVVTFSEVCNILEDFLPFEEAHLIEQGLLLRENILIYAVSQEDYINAISPAQEYHVGINDALTHSIMKREGIQVIYSFDKDFNSFQEIKRIAE